MIHVLAVNSFGRGAVVPFVVSAVCSDGATLGARPWFIALRWRSCSCMTECVTPKIQEASVEQTYATACLRAKLASKHTHYALPQQARNVGLGIVWHYVYHNAGLRMYAVEPRAYRSHFDAG